MVKFIKWLWSYRWVEVSRIPKDQEEFDDGGYGWVPPAMIMVPGFEITERQPATGKTRKCWVPR